MAATPMPPSPAASQPPAASVHWLVIGDDSGMMKQIERTHCPDGRKIDIKATLHVVKGILNECTNIVLREDSQGGGDVDNTPLPPKLQYEVSRLSMELARKSLDVEDDGHAKTVTLFNMLSSYSWEAKLALVLTAFVSSYGKYWLLAQAYKYQHPMAMNMVGLMRMSDMLKDGNQLQSLCQPLRNLINSILDLYSCIVEVKEILFSTCASSYVRAIPRVRATIIICSYWTIRSVVTSAAHMHSLFVKDPKTTSKDGELANLAGKIQALHKHLQQQLYNFYYKKLDAQDMNKEVKRALETAHVDNMAVPKLLAQWKSESWKLELAINDLDDTLIKMAREGKSICLYGGDDLEWIQTFTAKAKQVATSISVSLEMFFVGKCTDSLAKLGKIITKIDTQKRVSEFRAPDSAKTQSFWARLERMFLYRIQYLKKIEQNKVSSVVDDDGVLQGVEKLLDKGARRGWALFSKGNDIALIGDETITIKALNEFDKWKVNVAQRGFEVALKNHYETLQGSPPDRPCCRIHLQDNRPSDKILESIKCPECHQRLEKHVAFLCCHHY